jgi:glucose-1-phosphate cytidylyltransferase
VTYHNSHDEDQWEVTLADTGENTMTGGRVWRASKYLRPDDQHCFLTYGDGLANIDIRALYAHHLQQQKALTITAVHPTSRFGEMKVRGGKVTKFEEKPEEAAGLINGGFMVFKRQFVQRFLQPDDTLVFEKRPMQSAVTAGEMAAYVHTGFWQCMDTGREYQQLNAMWDRGAAPWTEAWQCSQTFSVVGGSSSQGTRASKGRGSRRGLAA